MGAYSPAPVVTDAIFSEIKDKVLSPIIKGLAQEGKFYKGVLYAGLMITKEGPKVLEFNVRFGDPQTQATLPRMETDPVDVIEASIDGTLGKLGDLKWRPDVCVCVVMAAGGYPGDYKKGMEIKVLDELAGLRDVMVFHAGTRRDDSKVLSDGGRVLGVTALGSDIENAIKRSYDAASRINFEGAHYRRDIGAKALKKVEA
jgi:phosphoribosylamine--glycine ligase